MEEHPLGLQGGENRLGRSALQYPAPEDFSACSEDTEVALSVYLGLLL